MSARVLLRLFALFGLGFGLACLNYTNGPGIEHHRQVAADHGWPGPSYALFLTGAALTAITAFVLGFSLGSGRRDR